MQIGNSRSNSPLPQDPKNTGLDPDLTKVNRDSIEKTSEVTAERTEAARKNLADRRAEMGQKSDKFERSRPHEDVGVDVGERLKNARAQAALEGRTESARTKNNERTEANRIDNARNERTRIEHARMERGAEVKSLEGDRAMADRIQGARSEHDDMQMTERVSSARKENAEMPVSDKRIDSARSQHAAEVEPRRIESARAGAYSRESVELSSKSRSMASNDLPGVGGRSETDIQRAERVEALRIANARGELNTPDRVRHAAGRLLGGE